MFRLAVALIDAIRRDSSPRLARGVKLGAVHAFGGNFSPTTDSFRLIARSLVFAHKALPTRSYEREEPRARGERNTNPPGKQFSPIST